MSDHVMTDAEISRFWSKVSLPDADGCMLWIGSIGSRHGYGKFALRRQMIRAHRISALLSVGTPASPSLEVAHSCRNRHCVAPPTSAGRVGRRISSTAGGTGRRTMGRRVLGRNSQPRMWRLSDSDSLEVRVRYRSRAHVAWTRRPSRISPPDAHGGSRDD